MAHRMASVLPVPVGDSIKPEALDWSDNISLDMVTICAGYGI